MKLCNEAIFVAVAFVAVKVFKKKKPFSHVSRCQALLAFGLFEGRAGISVRLSKHKRVRL